MNWNKVQTGEEVEDSSYEVVGRFGGQVRSSYLIYGRQFTEVCDRASASLHLTSSQKLPSSSVVGGGLYSRRKTWHEASAYSLGRNFL